MPTHHRILHALAWLSLLAAAPALAGPAVTTQIEDAPGTRFDRAPDDSFAGLKTVTNEDVLVSIRYRPDLGEVLNNRPGKDQDDPVRILRTRLAPGSPWYVFACSAGPSADPGCDVLREDGGGKHTRVAQLGGESFWVPGNGAVYSDGQANAYFPVRRKFVVKGDALVPIAQPFDYVGLHSSTEQRITLTTRRGGGEIVADLPAGTPVHVLLASSEGGPDGELDVLVATRFGLVGWWRQPEAGMQTGIKGLRFHGD